MPITRFSRHAFICHYPPPHPYLFISTTETNVNIQMLCSLALSHFTAHTYAESLVCFIEGLFNRTLNKAMERKKKNKA